MPRAVRVIAAQERRDARCIDTVILTSDQRRAARGDVIGAKGTRITIDLPAAPLMRTDDCLLLEGGRLVEVIAAAEPLCEVRAPELSALARLAWQLGDRHVAVEILPGRLRVRREPAVEALLAELGAKVVSIEAPFEPEGGAYAALPADSALDHGHDHDHHHDHHPHRQASK
jgi:urease accessory protein